MYPFMSNVTTNANNPIYVALLKEATVFKVQQALEGILYKFICIGLPENANFSGVL